MTIAPAQPVRTRRTRSWPGGVWRRDRTSIAPRAIVLAAVGAGVVAALTLHITVVGMGYLLTGTAIALAVFATRTVRPTAAQAVAVVTALALLAVLSVRGAGWLATVCVALSWVVGSFAVVGGRTWTGLAAGSFALWFTPLRVIRWTRRGASRWSSAERVSLLRVFGVAAVSAVLLLVFGSLFASADAKFAELLEQATPSVEVSNSVGRLVLGMLVCGGTLGAAYLLRRTPRVDALAPGPGRPVARWEWAFPLALLNLLFLGFVAVQLRVLFGGDRHVLTTDDLTYAEYARQGFWQLLAVTGLTLLVIAVALRKAARREAIDRTLVRVLLGLLCVLTLVIVASAVARMSLYESHYGYTQLRLLVLVTEVWLGLVFVLLLIAGLRLSGRWLPCAVLGSAVCGVLLLAVVDPDAYIAQKNVERFEETGRIDVSYLRSLSVDAVPALDRLPEPERSCALYRLQHEVDEGAEWYEYNAARNRARDLLAAHPVGRCDRVAS
ncbi:beta-carotene 15,15'-monooxygenase [Rhodococcus oxybenzonivorans]|uniref:Beta-carotene 15,15'-monooxygenase n=1 Tax=Rhodococcus oxybenzonivorans TaxID=1990687 RepID=A0A2S2BRX3_9NOCA|nr:DUF4173 domain-containing protein [Rhodococcus oxybenzonivorans]AWK71343.1 beta-carotene 15,15'-monooxygenase [Rhodococcus oxybenzonivorans]